MVSLNLSSPQRSVLTVIIILIQNTAFDTANASKENVAFVFVIGAVEYEMVCCFYF